MSDWDDAAAGWDEDEATRVYAASAFRSLEPVLSSAGIGLRDAVVLDFGCGTGQLTEYLVEAGARVLAVDTSSAMIAVLIAKVAENQWTDVETMTSLPDRSGVAGSASDLDLVVCSSVCAFLDDYPATVRDLAARLRPGGLFVQWDWERSSDADDHGLTKEEIRRALTDAELVDCRVDEAFAVTIGDHEMRPLIGHGRAPERPAGD